MQKNIHRSVDSPNKNSPSHSASVPITTLVKHATRAEYSGDRPINPHFLRKRATLGEIEHRNYERFVNLYNTKESLEHEHKAARVMLAIIIVGCVAFAAIVKYLS